MSRLNVVVVLGFCWLLLFSGIAFSAEGKQEVKNLVYNGGFEIVKGGRPVGWLRRLPKEGNASVTLSDIAHRGKYSIKLTNGSPKTSVQITPGDRYGFINIEPNTNYIVTYWVKGENLKDEGDKSSVRVSIGPRLGHFGSKSDRHFAVHNFPKNLPESGSFDWTKQSFGFSTKDDEVIYINFQLRLTRGTIWYDDISIEKVAEVKVKEPENW